MNGSKAEKIYMIGHYYRVPCVMSCAVPRCWIPVMLPCHSDREIIGFPESHFHYDFRFLSDYLYERLRRPSTARVVTEADVYRGPELSLKRCRRRVVAFGSSIDEFIRCRAEIPWLRPLERAYGKKSLICGRCPHRGADLSTVDDLPGSPGIIECPMHGLRWNRHTGKLVRTRLAK